MPQNKVERGFNLMEESIKLLQDSLAISFLDAYIENGENINDHNQVRVLDGLPKSETRQKIEKNYQQLEELELEAEEKRKLTQLVLLKGLLAEPVQANHQITPDAIGFLFVYLVEQLLEEKEEPTKIIDLTVGSANLLLTLLLNLELAGYQASGAGVDVDETMLAIAAVNAQWLGNGLTLYHQDSLQNLLLAPADFAIADLPIGYYPNDAQAEKFVVQAEEGHTYAHHLLMEQSMKYVKEDGFGLFLVPENFLVTEQGDALKKWLSQEVYLQGILRLPESLFKVKSSQKSLIIVQNRGETSQQAAEVLLAALPSLKEAEAVQAFFTQFKTWKKNNL